MAPQRQPPERIFILPTRPSSQASFRTPSARMGRAASAGPCRRAPSPPPPSPAAFPRLCRAGDGVGHHREALAVFQPHEGAAMSGVLMLYFHQWPLYSPGALVACPASMNRNLVRIGGAALALAATASYVQRRSARAERAHRPLGRFITVDGVTLHYLDEGDGPPL